MPCKLPNVIIITTDQQRADSLGCYGSDFVRTPAIDSLAADGTLFTRAYCANPVCTPSRTSIFGGNYVDRHGVWNCGIVVPETETFTSKASSTTSPNFSKSPEAGALPTANTKDNFMSPDKSPKPATGTSTKTTSASARRITTP
jgi:hypothetical protein